MRIMNMTMENNKKNPNKVGHDPLAEELFKDYT